MAHLALFRKYRSQSFDELTGQDHVTVTLRNALRMKRAGQAYLFCGPRGTGKTSTARIFAKSLNCLGADPSAPLLEPPEQPCNRCVLCAHITAGTCLDVSEMDAASNTGVDNIRDAVIGKADFAPVEGRRKVYIIDEVHKLSSAAFAALLKTLEEPPPHLVFILATTDPHEVPATILSRCQRFDFRRISQREILARLEWICGQEGLQADADALGMIAEAADGSLRDALVILEQASAFADGRITAAIMTTLLGVTDKAALFRLSGLLLSGRTAESLQLLDELIVEGRDLVGLARDMLGHVRALLIARVAGEARAILKVSDDQFQHLEDQARGTDVRDLMRMARVLMELEQELKDPVHARLNWEVAMIRLAAEGGAFPAAERPPRPEPLPQAAAVRAAGGTRPEPLPATPERAPAPAPPAPRPPDPRPQEPVPHVSESVRTAPARKPEPAPTRPAPPPSPGPQAAPASSGALLLEAFQGAWKQMLEGLKREKATPLLAKLVEAQPIAVAGDVCVVGIGSKMTWHREQIEARKADIASRLSTVLHRPVRLEVRIHDGPPPAAVSRPGGSAQGGDPRDEHEAFVQEGLNLFGGKIV